MPRGVSRLQELYASGKEDPMPEASADTATTPPSGELLGSIDPTTLDHPSPSFQGWVSDSGETIELEAGPPPWEVNLADPRQNTDARRFFREIPEEWMLRWMNPKMLQHAGPRWWKPVTTSHPRVKLIATEMRHVDNTVRRGGEGGDILHYMPRHWWESRLRTKAEQVRRATGAALDTMAEATGKATRTGYMTVDQAVHPTHTHGEGRSMKD